jgi:Mg2+ and Co2+ transporter CorA
MPNHWKSNTSQPLSTKGRRLDDIEKEEEEKKIEELRVKLTTCFHEFSEYESTNFSTKYYVNDTYLF